jgi:hypothetical protein
MAGLTQKFGHPAAGVTSRFAFKAFEIEWPLSESIYLRHFAEKALDNSVAHLSNLWRETWRSYPVSEKSRKDYALISLSDYYD